MVYRDLKQENIGFDIRGDVKIFDFGLCKSLQDKSKAIGHGYHMTPYTGSVPYMAPEIGNGQPYDQSADVFSFAILFWEILSMKDAFGQYSFEDYLTHVCERKERPRLHRTWPTIVQVGLEEAWKDDPQARPPMLRLANVIQGWLQNMTDDAWVEHRAEGTWNNSTSIRSDRELQKIE